MRWRHFTPLQKLRGVNGWLSSFFLLRLFSVPLGSCLSCLFISFKFPFGYTHSFILNVATAYIYRLVIGCLLTCLQIILSTIHVVHILWELYLFIYFNYAGLHTNSVLPIRVIFFVAPFELNSSLPVPRL